MTKNKYIKFAINIIEMVIGTALTAAAFGMIIIPQGFAAGGVTGFSKTIGLLIPIPLSALVLIVNILLLLTGLIFVGKRFAIKTVAVSILFPVMLEIFSRYPLTSLAGDNIICAISAGVTLGAGAGLVLRSGASSGGFDILAVVINKKFEVSVSTLLKVFDAAVIIMQAFGNPLSQTIYGIIVIIISGTIVERIVTLGTRKTQIMIFSDKYEQIRKELLETLDVGMTFLHAETGYLQKEMKVIVSIVPYQYVPEIKKMVTSIDQTAFVVVDEVHSVIGKGYTLDKHYQDLLK